MLALISLRFAGADAGVEGRAYAMEMGNHQEPWRATSDASRTHPAN
jgi:hypothetical protein